MPRQVDHEGRRRLIARAVFDLISERGIEGASMRDAAQRAGVSVGAVQRCFSTKEEMIIFVLGYMNQRVTERVQEKIAGARDPESALTMLEQTLIGILAVDEQSLAETRVWLAFTAQAAINPQLAVVQRVQYTGLTELFALLVRVAGERGHARPDIDADQEADSLVTFTDGLNVQILVGRHTPDSALAAVHQRIAALRGA
ncbi:MULTISPECIES: TetR/AcrR family transcriptional regulator [unclassified Streptomyces]|uniref:TetR/AcrR family transcriptional regulator n=1 Tax=unclassified Streptomyces TaxID=2593676 RepID=UPI002DDB0AEF|nr:MULTISPECIES: TetR/AcrR family transcriptional regulator [unclassified Streptomyces]WSA97714.1 TetR/AcrR family transcriptional regulator [Streptomyces sp. NBC_01795]WSB82034.1 TetR/AcrR family transcriptional regulator [Streptomyces sp. NBC_01775]WSS46767.1 TetR/AcrR family transcriptional regulator [Streptomyces sp. NBC_01187]WSS47016.1 TetR/AcrR family transcriptional regulator [Streptomyces sp. NBC_01187]